MKKRFIFLSLIFPITLFAYTGWWFVFTPGRIDKEVWVEKDEVFCGAVFSPLDTTDTLGRADQRWPALWIEMINCSTYFRNIYISGKFYLDDSLESDNTALVGKSKQRHDDHPAFGTAGWAICDSGNTNSAYGAWGFGTNSGSGSAYGGWFQGAAAGTGPHYGVYCKSDSLGIYAKTTALATKYAGYFEGSVLITDTTFHSFYKPVRTQYYEGWADTHKIHADSLWWLNAAYINQGNAGTNIVTGFQSATLSGVSNQSTGDSSVVCGGSQNIASQRVSVVGGGQLNTASGGLSTVAGGAYNTASKTGASVGGGANNTASGNQSTVAGGQANTCAGTGSTIGGGQFNSGDGDQLVIAGGAYNYAFRPWTTIGGGYHNTCRGHASTVSGGYYNTTHDDGRCNALGGGYYNWTGDSCQTIAGGHTNRCEGYPKYAKFAAILGGKWNYAQRPYGFPFAGYACSTFAVYDGACGNHCVTLGDPTVDGCQMAMGGGSVCDSTYNSGAVSGQLVDTDSTWVFWDLQANHGLGMPSGTTPAPDRVGYLFLDTDASPNGTIVCYANGAWRTVVVLP